MDDTHILDFQIVIIASQGKLEENASLSTFLSAHQHFRLRLIKELLLQPHSPYF